MIRVQVFTWEGPDGISVILDPGRVWSDHAVIDTVRHVRICTCTDERDADLIAKVLNIHQQQREAKALLTEGSNSNE